jgi:hypothetical protein
LQHLAPYVAVRAAKCTILTAQFWLSRSEATS